MTNQLRYFEFWGYLRKSVKVQKQTDLKKLNKLNRMVVSNLEKLFMKNHNMTEADFKNIKSNVIFVV